MRKLIAFNQVTLDGYFADMNGDISWANKDNQDAEWNAFVADNVNGGGHRSRVGGFLRRSPVRKVKEQS